MTIRELCEKEVVHRENSPLKQADDAVLLDSSDMTLKEVVDTITAMIDKKQGA